ncbi:hypothetical protein AB0I66_21335 [Streptomyces sp. NPDC050439]|uniref:hypothetical protein n=1 Tax=unclassified Streptomyces TaxID=2593676 RepID=UPI003420E7DA
MNGVPFSFADCIATFGPEEDERKIREAREAPRFTQEQILRGRALWASLPLPSPRPADSAADAA